MSAGGRRERLAPFAIVLVGLAVFVLVRRFHPVRTLGNPDIAGILYNADLLAQGLLPYRDSLDLKPPGAFFVVAAAFRWVGRDLPTLHAVYEGFALLGAPAVWLAAHELHPRSRLAPAAAAALYLVTIGAFDMNYSSWMTTPYAWSFALLLRGLRTGGVPSHLGAGALALTAVLFKAQAVVLAPLFAAVWLWARRARWAGATLRAPLYWAGGALFGFAPLCALYASAGALPELFRGVFPIGEAVEYTERMQARPSVVTPLLQFAKRQGKAFGLQIALVAATLVGLARDRRAGDRTDPIAPQVLFYAASAWGCGIGGMRFYLHYLPQLLPAFALLAAHPAAWRWLGAARDRGARAAVRVASAVHLVILAAVTIYAAVGIPRGKAAMVDYRGVISATEVGRYIEARTTPDDRVLCWGWPAWPVYYFSGRRSPSTIFKVLGQVTEFNGNPAYEGGQVIRFKPGPHADRLLADVEAHPPAFIVRASPFFPGIVNEPLDEFAALKRIVDARYRLVLQVNHLGVYERIDRTPAHTN